MIRMEISDHNRWLLAQGEAEHGSGIGIQRKATNHSLAPPEAGAHDESIFLGP